MKTTTLIGLSMGLIDRGTLEVLRMRLIAPLLLLLLMLAGAASATDYYVATWGDNTTQGNITHPWQNVTYAVEQATTPGDTIYMFDGTWYDEHPYFKSSGTAGNPITITSYNGTPILDGVDWSGVEKGIMIDDELEYITVSGSIIIKNYSTGITIYDNTSHVNVSDVTVKDLTGDGIYVRPDCNHIIIDNVTVENTSDHGMHLHSFRETPPTRIHNVTIKNCNLNDTDHNGISIHENCQDITVENCSVSHATNVVGIVVHNRNCQRITIRNNTVDTCQRGIAITGVDDGTIENNIISNSYASYGITITSTDTYAKSEVENVIIKNNVVTNSAAYGVYIISDLGKYVVSDIIFENNSIEKKFQFVGTNTSNITIRDMYGVTRDVTLVDAVPNLVMEFTDNKLFSEDCANAPYWYPDKSNLTIGGTGTTTITTYNITTLPTNAYLKDATINRESNSTYDITNLTINSSVSSNPTWANATMQNASANYSVSVDGAVVEYIIADADAVVRYQYTASWSPHDFEFSWIDQGTFSPDHSKSYHNTTSPITNSVNDTGYITYDRTLGWGDTVRSSGSLKVTT